MRSGLSALLFLVAGLIPAWSGTITGTIRGAPPAGAAEPPGSGAYESRRYKYVEKIDYDKLRDFVVHIDQSMGEFTSASPEKQTVKTTQRDANFDPHVLPVMVGTTVRWPNDDDIFHNVFSM